jgi:hypothetical protein
VGFTEPGRSPGLLVSSYLTVSPLPDKSEDLPGGLLSVALSLASRPVGVTHHCVLWSPDFPPARRLGAFSALCARPAIIRPASAINYIADFRQLTPAVRKTRLDHKGGAAATAPAKGFLHLEGQRER